MKALSYKFSIPGYLAARAADRLPVKVLESGRIPGLSEIEVGSKPLPGPEWLRIRPKLTGICGSDISTLTNRSSPALMPFVSFPMVPGHEVVAEVIEAGAGVTGAKPGDRIVVNPVISCHMRGLEPCRSCANDEPGLCLNSAEGNLAPGMLTGFCKDLNGGWSEEMIIHQSQMFRIPDQITDDTAVLVEPFSVALHAVLKDLPTKDAKILLIGGGTIGLLVLSAIRMLGLTNDVTILVRHAVQEKLATQLGATRVLRGKGAGEAAMQVTGAKRYKPLRGPDSYTGGFDWVYDCVGSKGTVGDSLRVAGPKAHVVMVGCAGDLPHLDLTFLWARELNVTGCYVYGKEHAMEDSPHTFDVAIRLLADKGDYPIDQIVTHRFPLEKWREALSVSLQRGSHDAIKVVFEI